MGQRVVGLLEGLLGGAVLDPGGVQARGQLEVGVAHEAHGDLTGVLGRGGVELVDVPGGQPELELDVGEGRAGAHPELAVAGVGEELVAVAVGERAEVEHGLVTGCRAVVARDRLEHEHGVRFAVGAEAGEPGERGVWAEHVVGVVAAHLEPTGGDDQPLLRVRGAEHGPALGGVGRGRCRATDLAAPGGPALADEGAELVGRRPGAVVCLLLLLAHPPMLPRGPGPAVAVKDFEDGSAQRDAQPRPRRGARDGRRDRLRRPRLGGRRGGPSGPAAPVGPTPTRRRPAAAVRRPRPRGPPRRCRCWWSCHRRRGPRRRRRPAPTPTRRPEPQRRPGTTTNGLPVPTRTKPGRGVVPTPHPTKPRK